MRRSLVGVSVACIALHYACSAFDAGDGAPAPPSGPDAGTNGAIDASAGGDAGAGAGGDAGAAADAACDEPTNPSVPALREGYACGCKGWTVRNAATIEATAGGRSGPGSCRICKTAPNFAYVFKSFSLPPSTSPVAPSYAFSLYARSASDGGPKLFAGIDYLAGDGGSLSTHSTETGALTTDTWAAASETSSPPSGATELRATIEVNSACADFDDVVLEKQ